MEATHRAEGSVAVSTPMRQESGAAPARAYLPALGYLRAFLVVLVVAHHSVIAYLGSSTPYPKSLLSVPRWWRAFPVVDPRAHWMGFGIFVGFNDDFFMSLMFLVSGLFVWSSLRRKGDAVFLSDRMKRLGIPFLFAAAIVAPLAYYPAYLMTGAHGIGGYVHDWLSFGDWPTGPAWFIWLLLAFDLAAGALYALAPNFGDALGRHAAGAREHPVRFFLLLAAASLAAFLPMTAIFGPVSWTSVGPFQFQTARLFHYAVYFFAGIGVGAYGIERGLLASDGALARHWGRWTAWAIVVFILSIIFVLIVMSKPGLLPMGVLRLVGGAIFVLACASLSFAFLAIFVRFIRRRSALWDSLSANEYGIYLIHYMFVSWVQYAMLPAAMPGIAKGLIAFGCALALSWATSAALRSIPAIARVV
jgi:peptidoglycan/LPS O-acetylase OafA/YrhL